MKPIYLYLDEALTKGAAENDSDIGRKIGATRSAVSSWRSGRRVPDDDQAVKLAELLGKDPGELLAECGAARAKTPETRRAWERIAARMAASGITACVLAMTLGQSQDVQASAALPYQESGPSNFQNTAVRRFVLALLGIFKKFRHLHTQRCSQSNHRIGRHPATMCNVAVQCGVRHA